MPPSFFRLAPLALASGLLLPAAGCSSEEGAGGPGPDAGGSAASGGTGGTGAVVSDGCTFPAGATEIAAPQVYGSVIYKLSLDETHVYFNTIDSVFRVPRAGGTPDSLYTNEAAIVPAFWLRASDLVVSPALDTFEAIPKAGGPATLTKTIDRLYAKQLSGEPRLVLEADGNTFFGREDAGVLDDADVADYFSFELTTSGTATTELIADTAAGYREDFVKRGDAIFTTSHPANPTETAPTDPSPTKLYRIDTAAQTVTELSLSPSLRAHVIAVDETHIFLNGRPNPFSISDAGGIYRVPITGGTAEQIIPLALGGSFSNTVNLPGFILIRALDNAERFFRVAHDGGAVTPLFTTSCEVHSVTASETDIFVSTFDDENETATIHRAPL